MMPPRNWLAAVLLLRMRPQSKEPRKAGDADFAGDGVDAGFAEHRAVGMHRPVGGFERLGCCGFGDDAVAAGALQDGRVGFVPARIAEMGEAAVEAADFLGFAVRVEVGVERTATLRERVEGGRLDLALLWGSVAGSAVACVPMTWLGSRAGFVRQQGAPVPLVVFEPPCLFREAATAALDAAGIPWRVVFSSPALSGLLAAVATGLGVTPRTSFGLPTGVRSLRPGQADLPTLACVAACAANRRCTPDASRGTVAKHHGRSSTRAVFQNRHEAQSTALTVLRHQEQPPPRPNCEVAISAHHQIRAFKPFRSVSA